MGLKRSKCMKIFRKEVPFLYNTILCKYEKPQHFLSWKCSFIYLYHVVNITLTYHWTGLIYFFYAPSMVMGQLFIVCSSQLTENTHQTNTMTLYSKAPLVNLSIYYAYIVCLIIRSNIIKNNIFDARVIFSIKMLRLLC